MDNKIAIRLSNAREKLRLSRRQLGEAIGSNETQIWRYETGKNEPTAEMIFRLSQALSTPSDYLLGLVDSWEVISPDQKRLLSENKIFTIYTDRVRLDNIESKIVEMLIHQTIESKVRILKMIELMIETPNDEEIPGYRNT